jgi:pre-rRNA-processing protein IPI1
LGLRELFEDYPDVIVASLSIILNGCARVIGDEVKFNYFEVILSNLPFHCRTQACAKHFFLFWAGYYLEYHMYVGSLGLQILYTKKCTSQEVLIPHTPILLLFTTSAQTHIFPEIRIDAIRFLDLFLELFPEVVAEGWVDGHGGHGRRVIEGYLGVLNAGTAYGEGGGMYVIISMDISSSFGQTPHPFRQLLLPASYCHLQ